MFISALNIRNLLFYLLDSGWACMIVVIIIILMHYNRIHYQLIEEGMVDKYYFNKYKVKNNDLINISIELKYKIKKYKENWDKKITEEVKALEQQVAITIKHHRLDIYRQRYSNITNAIRIGTEQVLNKYIDIMVGSYNELIIQIFCA